jgi:hypothetical protein
LLLIDEPGLPLASRSGVSAETFAAGLQLLHNAGTVSVVLATPHEYALIMPHLGPDAPKDVLVPPPLDEPEIARMAIRADWGLKVVDRVRAVNPSWLRTPFLLELVLHVAEEQNELRTDAAALVQAAVDEAERRDYLTQLLHNGLSGEQRRELRVSRWQAAGIDVGPMPQGSLLSRTPLPQDPVVAHHLPEVLRIHHISDLHHGGTLRATVDAKDRSRAGRQIEGLVGAGTPLDSYLSHVAQLAAQGQAPHLVIVTGDIVDRPDPAFGEQAVSWLRRLRQLLADHRDLRPEDPRIVIVGGNHDVSWDLCLEADRLARHRWFARMFDDFPHPDLHLPAGPERRLFVKYPNTGLRLALLGSAESGGEAARDADRERLEIVRAAFIEAENEEAVRSAVHDLERIDPGVLSRAMLDRLTHEAGYVTLALLHHPLSPVPSVEIAPYTGIVNAGQAKRALVTARTALVLHGHTHLSFLSAERLLSAASGWTIRIAGASTLAAASSDEQNGYNQVFITREGGSHALIVRPVRFDGGQWEPQSSVAFRPGEPCECELIDVAGDGPEVARPTSRPEWTPSDLLRRSAAAPATPSSGQ